MSLPQFITYEQGGTLTIDLLSKPTAVTVDVQTDQGASISSGNATISTIGSTLSAAASKGATQVSVAATTGMAAGSRFWIQDDPEEVLIQKIASLVVYLKRPLLKDHVSGATVQGTRCSYAVSSSDADELFWDGRVKWTVDSVIHWTAVECTKYPMTRKATVQNLYDRHSKLYEILDSTVDAERLLDLGYEELLQRIGGKGRARTFTASTEFIQANVLAALMLHFERSATDEGQRLWDRYSKLLDSELQRVTATTPRDADQDGLVEESDRMSWRTIKLRR